jgi:hypothetical protein
MRTPAVKTSAPPTTTSMSEIRKTVCELCVANAVAKIGAGVKTAVYETGKSRLHDL